MKTQPPLLSHDDVRPIWIDGDMEEDRRRQAEEKASDEIDHRVEERRRRVDRQSRWLRARKVCIGR